MSNEWQVNKRAPVSNRLPKLLLIVLSLMPSCLAVYDVGDVECKDTLRKLDIHNDKEITVRCPSSCIDGYCKVIGSGPYTASSSICCAAIHNGTLHNTDGGEILVKITHALIPHFIGSTRNGIKSRNEFQQSTVTFITEKIHAPTTTTAQPTTSTTTTQISTTSEKEAVGIKEEVRRDEQTTITTEKSEKLESAEDHEDDQVVENDDENDDTSQSSSTKWSQLVVSPSTPAPTEIKIIETVAIRTTEEEYPNRFYLPRYLLVIALVISFICGAISMWICMCVRRNADCSGSKRQKPDPVTYRKSNSRSACDEGDICVCYENLSSSKQHLMYDPETCTRACPVRNPLEADSLLDDITMTQSFDLQKSFNHEKKGDGETKKCGIRYEEECATACSGACNPKQFEF